jgi:zinc transporter 7
MRISTSFYSQKISLVLLISLIVVLSIIITAINDNSHGLFALAKEADASKHAHITKHSHKHDHDRDHKNAHEHHKHEHEHSHDHHHTSSQSQLAMLHAFFPKDPAYAALTATAYVSLAPIAVLFFIPNETSEATLNTLVSFAVGSLLGDVFLHLLPHAFAPHSHEHEHEHEHEHHHYHAEYEHDHTRGLYIGLAVLAGFMTFFSIERGMRLLNESEGGHRHHHHSHQHTTDDNYNGCTDDNELHGGQSSAVKTPTKSKGRKRRSAKSTDNQQTSTVTNCNTISKATNASLSLKLSAYLNLLADATHNFTDGLAVAAAFYASRSLGITTAVACFFHEIPHEIGDYAILLRSGFSRFRAAMAQAITALGAFAGTAVGIWLKSNINKSSIGDSGGEDIDLVMPFTAGGFIYVATVGVVPELLAARGVTIRQSIAQLLAMSVGVGLMALIALNE